MRDGCYQLEICDGAARAGYLTACDGMRLPTPLFQPVATAGSLKTLDWEDLRGLGYGHVLMNTYHLVVRPGLELIRGAGGVCVLLIKRPAPIIKGPLDMSDGVHHAFMVDAAEYQAAVDGLRAKGVDVFFEEDRRGGTIDGPRAYFRDPDGTALEFINRTAYVVDK